MADRTVTRQLSIFINDREVVNSISGIGRAISITNRQLNNLDASSENFSEDLERLTRQSEELTERQRLLREEIHGSALSSEEAREAFSNIFVGLSTGNIAMATAGLTAIKGAILTLTRTAMRFIATPLGATIAALAAVALVTKEWYDYNKEVAKADKLTQAITKLSGDAADEARIRATAMAKTFDQDFEQLLDTASALVNEFDISYNEAFNRIENGFIKGGDASDEFLESMREYPTFFAQAGFSAEEFQNIINTGADLSIYQDKLPDAIKEFSLAITEQTVAAKEALYNAFGTDFTDRLLKGVKDGSISVKDALAQISAEANRIGLNAQQAQLLTADLFKGAGEDAGGAMKIFKAYNQSIEAQYKPLTEAQQATEALAQSERDALTAKDAFLKSDGFGVWSTKAEAALNVVSQRFYEFMSYVVGARKELEDAYKLQADSEFNAKIEKDEIARFKDRMERNKKIVESIGKTFDFEKEKAEYLARLQENIDSTKSDRARENLQVRFDAVQSYLNKTSAVTNKNSLDDINAQKAANKKKQDEDKKQKDWQDKQDKKVKEDARKAWIKSEMDYYDDFAKAEQEITTLLKMSRQERANNLLTAGEKEDAEITQRWEAELEKYKVHTTRRAELEAARDAELKEARVRRAKEEAAEQAKINAELGIAEAGDKDTEEALRRQLAYDEEKAQYKKLLDDKKITYDQYQRFIASLDKKSKEAERIAQIQSIENKLNEYSRLAGALTAIFGQNKELAMATALINGGLAVTEILKTPSVLPEPMASISRGIQIAAAVATTSKSIAQIKSQKTPKTAKFYYGGYGKNEGGYTGNKILYPDEYGGVTKLAEYHEDEYTIPAKMMAIPAVANTAAWLENIRTGKAGSTGNSNEIQQIPANSNNSGAASTGDPELKAMLAVLVQRLENPVAPVIVYGYEDLERQNKMQDDISSSKNNGKLST